MAQTTGVYLYRGAKGPVITVPEATAGSAAAFYAGDLVKTDANGELIIATAGVVLGIALKTALGTHTNYDVELINPNSTYVASTSATATLQSMVGDIGDFTFTAGGQYITGGGGSNDAEVLGFVDIVGTSSGRVEFRFMPTAYDKAR